MSEDRKRRLPDTRVDARRAADEREMAHWLEQARRSAVCIRGVDSAFWLEFVAPVLKKQVEQFSEDAWDPREIATGEDFLRRRDVALAFRDLLDTITTISTEDYRREAMTKAEEIHRKLDETRAQI